MSTGLAFALWSMLTTTPVAHAAWQPSLVPAEKGARTPVDPLRIALPADIPQAALDYLALDVDRIDVTNRVYVEHGEIIYEPPVPLATGTHRVRLVQYRPDGGFEVRGDWRFDVSESGTDVTRVRLDGNVSLSARYRVADDGSPQPEPIDLGSGSADVSGTVDGNGWSLETAASLIYDSRGVPVNAEDIDESGQPGPQTREVELGEYFVKANATSLSGTLGHHRLPEESLVMRDFYRRGASVRFANSERFSAGGFAFRTEPVTGFDHFTGADEHDDRVVGAIASGTVASTSGGDIDLTATILTGEGSDRAGVGVATDRAAADGDAASIALTGGFLDERVVVQGEIARSRFDFDSLDEDDSKAQDDAYQFSVSFDPWRSKLIGDQPAYWRTRIQYEKIGTLFRSLANPGQLSDVQAMRLTTRLGALGWSVDGRLSREEDNVDNTPGIARYRSDLASLFASFTPPREISADTRPRWFGQPTFLFGVDYTRQTDVSTPVGAVDFALDNMTRQITLGANFVYENWDWGINHSFGDLRDGLDRSPDSENSLTDLALNYRFGERLFLGAQVQRSTIHESGLGLATDGYLAGLNAYFVIVPSKLSGSAYLTWNRQSARDDSYSTRTRTLDLNLEWQARPPRTNRPGFTVFLQGQYQHLEDELVRVADSRPYRVFVGVTMDTPFALRRPR